MGAIQYDEKTGSIEITYGGREAPFTGIDSSAPPPYIAAAGLLPTSENVICIDNSLRAMNWLNTFFNTGTTYFVGYGDLLGEVFGVAYDAPSNSINIFLFPNWPATSTGTLVGNVPVPNYSGTPVQNSLTFKNVNGVCFFSFPGLPYILQHNNITAGILTDYLGCAYINELNGRLLAMDVFQFSGGSGGGGTTYTPTTTSSTTSVNQSGNGTNSANGAPATGFPSVAIGGASVVINLAVEGQILVTPPFMGTGNIQYEYSLDSGTTWTTGLAQASNSTQSYPSNFTTITVAGTIANLDTLQVRARVVATALSGSTVNVTASCSQITATVGTGGGGAGVITEFPYQFAWSAAEGSYAIFNPLDVNNLVTGAGFNNLPDVEDTITGYFNVGPTGYILRSQGITEVSPLNSGILPFDFNHLWASHKGIGTIYPSTVAQYGSVGAFLSDTGIYTIGYDGINTIDNKAKSAIYGELIINLKAQNLSMTLGPIQLDGDNFLSAVILAQDGPNSAIVYIFNFVTKEWYRTVADIGQSITSIAALAVNQNISSTRINSVYLVMNTANGFFASSTGVASSLVNSFSSTVVFPVEEVKIQRDITVDGIIIYYLGNLNGNTSFNLAVDLVGKSLIAQASTDDVLVFDGNWHYVILYPIGNVLTTTAPQISVTSSSFGADVIGISFWIGKVVLFGSIDSTQRPL